MTDHSSPVAGTTVAAMATPPESAVRTRDLLWADIEDIYQAILAHPFVTGLTDGTLPRASFRHYIVQDAHYLRGYARALALCGARATNPADTLMFAEHAAGAMAAEHDLHAALMDELGGAQEQAAGGAGRPRRAPPPAWLLPARDDPRRLVRRSGQRRAPLLLDLRAGR